MTNPMLKRVGLTWAVVRAFPRLPFEIPRIPGTAILIATATLWTYWPPLCEMARRWSSDPRYSHGYLVPAFSGALLWQRRAMLSRATGGGEWWGLSLVGAGMGLYLAGAFYYVEWVEGLSLLPTLAGLCAVWHGWGALKVAMAPIAFLVFMVPLPFRLENSLGSLLQHAATVGSTYALQTLGFSARGEGNIILLEASQLGVVEACSGLSMLMLCAAVAVGLLLILRRHWLDNLVVIVSILPIAVGSNVARITTSGALHELVGGPVADTVFHDLAGWLMMPLALGLVYGELLLLSALFDDTERGRATCGHDGDDTTGPSLLGRAGQPRAGSSAGGAVLQRCVPEIN